MGRQPLASAANRRDFLKLAAAAGGAFAVGGVASGALAEPERENAQPVSAKPKQGYRETAHIRTYYEKARI